MLISSILLGVIIVGMLSLFITYNGLIAKKNQANNAFSSIDVFLKKRYDLIPNLVATVKTYMTHEAKVLTEIAELRARAVSGNIPDGEKMDINNKLSRALGGIMVAVENYPDLKANQNFLKLQEALNEIEEQISAARRAYNAAVTDYNNALEMFPSNIIASLTGFTPRSFFEAPQEERQNVNVQDLFNK